MGPARIPLPIFGVLARSAAARRSLSLRTLGSFCRLWSTETENSDWLFDQEHGVALFRPSLVARRSDGSIRYALALRGSIRPAAGMRARGVEDFGRHLDADPEKAVRNCRGDFVLAFWNIGKLRLNLARDHLGRRSLFYRVTSDHLIFCSEFSPLLRAPFIERAGLDHVSAFWELAFGGPAPGRTLARDVRQLPAAHIASWSPGAVFREDRYWSPLRVDAPSEASSGVIAEIGAALESAVRHESNLEGSNCIALSGGVDSGLVAQMLVQHTSDLLALTMRYEDGQDANETEYAGYLARELGVALELVYLDADGALELLDNVVLESAEPCAAWASLSQAAICARMRSLGCDFLISGFGADEIFGGYDQFRIAHGRYLRRLHSAPVPSGVHPLDWYLPDPRTLASRTFFSGIARFFDDRALRRYLREPFRHWSYFDGQKQFYAEALAIKPEATSIELMAAHECQRRIPDIVLKSFNPIGLRYGVNLAYPFLAPEICEFAIGLDTASRYRTARGDFSLRRTDLEPGFKWTIMQLAKGRLPPAIIERPRKSFTAPFAIWMRQAKFRNYVIGRIVGSALWELDFLTPRAFEDCVAALEAGPGPNAHMLWRILTLAAWVDRYVA